MKEIFVESEALAKKHGVRCIDEVKAARIAIEKSSDLKKAAEANADYLLMSTPNWKIIPLENLIAAAKGAKIIAEVRSVGEAKTALETLEKGADAVLLKNASGDAIERLKSFVCGAETLRLSTARITLTKKLGVGSRSCIDTCEIMAESEGMLVGCQAGGLFLLQAEVSENPHVATRPFRVNAGAVSLYTLAPEGKTRYLSEIAAGDEVLVVDRSGSTRKTCVARNKIERRPLMLIEAEAEGKTIKTIAQDAETIRVMTPGGSKSVAELRQGDEVLVLLAESKARHFGMQVEETITEQ